MYTCAISSPACHSAASVSCCNHTAASHATPVLGQAYHTKGLTGIDIDASRSGAEVWVQVRSGEVADATAAQEQEELLQVTVQPGWSPGSEQVVPTAAGQGVSIVIPSDARPGSTISVAVPVQKPGAGTSINWVRMRLIPPRCFLRHVHGRWPQSMRSAVL